MVNTTGMKKKRVAERVFRYYLTDFFSKSGKFSIFNGDAHLAFYHTIEGVDRVSIVADFGEQHQVFSKSPIGEVEVGKHLYDIGLCHYLENLKIGFKFDSIQTRTNKVFVFFSIKDTNIEILQGLARLYNIKVD